MGVARANIPIKIGKVLPPPNAKTSPWWIDLGEGIYVPIWATENADIRIDPTVKLGPDTIFGMPGKPIEKLVIGRHTTLYGGQYAPSKLVIGDFVTIHKDVFMFGKSSCVIGHNSWFGMRCTIDCEGEWWEVGNNFGAGQDSHMWSHIAHGDRALGCKYYDLSRGFSASDDVWLVGRCTSGPLHHDRLSVALTESNLTKPMGFNTVWGGNPAKDLTDKIGHPYESTSAQIQRVFSEAVAKFDQEHPDLPIGEIVGKFDLLERTFHGEATPETDTFHMYMLKKQKIKFVPANRPKVTIND